MEVTGRDRDTISHSHRLKLLLNGPRITSLWALHLRLEASAPLTASRLARRQLHWSKLSELFMV